MNVIEQQEHRPAPGPRTLPLYTAGAALTAIGVTLYGLLTHDPDARITGALIAMACVTITALLLYPPKR